MTGELDIRAVNRFVCGAIDQFNTCDSGDSGRDDSLQPLRRAGALKTVKCRPHPLGSHSWIAGETVHEPRQEQVRHGGRFVPRQTEIRERRCKRAHLIEDVTRRERRGHERSQQYLSSERRVETHNGLRSGQQLAPGAIGRPGGEKCLTGKAKCDGGLSAIGRLVAYLFEEGVRLVRLARNEGLLRRCQQAVDTCGFLGGKSGRSLK